MQRNFDKDVKLFLIFDILGDIVRTGPILWHIERERLEDVKDHVFDLLVIVKILKKYFPENLDYEKISDYIICHDLAETITGDITKFEGVSDSEIKRVTEIAIDYLASEFDGVLELKRILNDYEEKIDLESKVVNMIDKLNSASTFIKYQSEHNVDMDNPNIIKSLRNHPFVVEKIAEGCDLADIFYQFHMKSINISDDECEKYGISRDCADTIVFAIRGFASKLYQMKLDKTLLNSKNHFPQKAMKYNRTFKDNS